VKSSLFTRGLSSHAPTAPRHTRRACHGFTLIEILVVLVIVGIAVALVSVNFATPPERRLREAGERLLMAMQAAQIDALTTGKSLAWKSDGAGYAFFRRADDRTWSVTLSGEPFAPAPFGYSTSLALVEINQRGVEPGTPLVFSASGTGEPFRVVLEATGEQLVIAGDTGGEIRLEAATGAAPKAGGG